MLVLIAGIIFKNKQKRKKKTMEGTMKTIKCIRSEISLKILVLFPFYVSIDERGKRKGIKEEKKKKNTRR